MCAEFSATAKLSELAELFEITITPELKKTAIPARIFPHSFAPVIIKRASGRLAVPMNFSLVPSWSKERRPKFATHNARIESVMEKNTWRAPFLHRRCIVPISYFLEPIYSGRFAGSMVRFQREDGSPLFAAALHDSWRDPNNDSTLESFALLTENATDLVASTGHDRQPIFITWEGASEWLSEEPLTGDSALALLSRFHDRPTLVVSQDRVLKSAAQRRAPAK